MARQFLSALFQARLSVDIFHCLYSLFILDRTSVLSPESSGAGLNLLSVPVLSLHAPTVKKMFLSRRSPQK